MLKKCLAACLVFCVSIHTYSEPITPPILWTTKADGTLINSQSLPITTAHKLTPFLNSSLYISGSTLSGSNFLPAFAIRQSNHSVQVFELTNNGTSFQNGQARDIAFLDDSTSFIVGDAKISSNSNPYLWIRNPSGSTQTIELTNNGTSFGYGGANSVALSPNSTAFIGGGAGVNQPHSTPYLWIRNPSGSIQAIELTNNGTSFGYGLVTSIALLPNSTAYIIGFAGNDSNHELPYLWIRDPDGSIQTIQFTSHDSEILFGVVYQITLSTDSTAYIVGTAGSSSSSRYRS